MMELLHLFITFFLIGLFSIGGGYAVIPLIQTKVVSNYAWLSLQEFTDIITISQMTPGPLAVNTASFVGIRINGIMGAVLATVGVITGGVFISNILYQLFNKYQNFKLVTLILNNLKATSVGLIMGSAMIILNSATKLKLDETFTLDNINYFALLSFSLSLFLLKKYKLNPMLIIFLSGLSGLVLYM